MTAGRKDGGTPWALAAVGRAGRTVLLYQIIETELPMAFTIQDKMWSTLEQMPEEWQAGFALALMRYGFTGEMPDRSEPWYLLVDAYTDRIDLSQKRSRSGAAGGRHSGESRRHEATEPARGVADAEPERADAASDADRATDTEATEGVADSADTDAAQACEADAGAPHSKPYAGEFCFRSKNRVSKTCFGTEKEKEKEKEKETESSTCDSPSVGTGDPPGVTPALAVGQVEGIEGTGHGRLPLECMRRRVEGTAWCGAGERVWRTQVEAVADAYRTATGRGDDGAKRYVRQVAGLCPAGCDGSPERAKACFELVMRALDRYDPAKARDPIGITRAVLADRQGQVRRDA